MTSTSSLPAEAAALPRAVTVALLGDALPSAERLAAALASLPTIDAGDWAVSGTPDGPVDIAVCDSPNATAEARTRWPEATVLVVAPACDDDIVLAALHTDVDLCVRETDPTLIAAFLHSVARRRGLLSHGGAR